MCNYKQLIRTSVTTTRHALGQRVVGFEGSQMSGEGRGRAMSRRSPIILSPVTPNKSSTHTVCSPHELVVQGELVSCKCQERILASTLSININIHPLCKNKYKYAHKYLYIVCRYMCVYMYNCSASVFPSLYTPLSIA